MTSVDTNILLYALNRDAPEHGAARAFLEARNDDDSFVLSELVLVELYVLLRNPSVVTHPLGAKEAAGVVDGFRTHPRWQLVDHAPEVMDDVWKLAARPGFSRTRIFDARLAASLRHHGVTEVATRNVKDFRAFGFRRVFDPLR